MVLITKSKERKKERDRDLKIIILKRFLKKIKSIGKIRTNSLKMVFLL